MIEVFKTDVEEHVHANALLQVLREHYPGSRINFDLDDRDRILRVEGHCDPSHVVQLLQQNGYSCTILE